MTLCGMNPSRPWIDPTSSLQAGHTRPVPPFHRHHNPSHPHPLGCRAFRRKTGKKNQLPCLFFCRIIIDHQRTFFPLNIDITVPNKHGKLANVCTELCKQSDLRLTRNLGAIYKAHVIKYQTWSL